MIDAHLDLGFLHLIVGDREWNGSRESFRRSSRNREIGGYTCPQSLPLTDVGSVSACLYLCIPVGRCLLLEERRLSRFSPFIISSWILLLAVNFFREISFFIRKVSIESSLHLPSPVVLLRNRCETPLIYFWGNIGFIIAIKI